MRHLEEKKLTLALLIILALPITSWTKEERNETTATVKIFPEIQLIKQASASVRLEQSTEKTSGVKSDGNALPNKNVTNYLIGVAYASSGSRFHVGAELGLAPIQYGMTSQYDFYRITNIMKIGLGISGGMLELDKKRLLYGAHSIISYALINPLLVFGSIQYRHGFNRTQNRPLKGSTEGLTYDTIQSYEKMTAIIGVDILISTMSIKLYAGHEKTLSDKIVHALPNTQYSREDGNLFGFDLGFMF